MAIAQAGSASFTNPHRFAGGGSLSLSISYNAGASVLVIMIYDQNNSCSDLSSVAFSSGTIVKYDCQLADNGSNYIYYVASPTGTSGTFTATAGASDVYLHSGAYSGTDTTTPIQQDTIFATGGAHTWSPTGVPTGSVAMVTAISNGGACVAGTNLSCIASTWLSSDSQLMMDSIGNSIGGSPSIASTSAGFSFGHFVGVILQPPQAVATNSGFFFAAAA